MTETLALEVAEPLVYRVPQQEAGKEEPGKRETRGKPGVTYVALFVKPKAIFLKIGDNDSIPSFVEELPDGVIGPIRLSELHGKAPSGVRNCICGFQELIKILNKN